MNKNSLPLNNKSLDNVFVAKDIPTASGGSVDIRKEDGGLLIDIKGPKPSLVDYLQKFMEIEEVSKTDLEGRT